MKEVANWVLEWGCEGPIMADGESEREEIVTANKPFSQSCAKQC